MVSRRKLYIAGDVVANDWRRLVIPNFDGFAGYEGNWPTTPTGPFDYIGPYVGAGLTMPKPPDEYRQLAVGDAELTEAEERRLALRYFGHYRTCALDDAEIVFAWMEERDATNAGGAAEVGYAAGKGKPVVFATHGKAKDDLWYIGLIAHMSHGSTVLCPSPLEAFADMCRKEENRLLLESPIEVQFWDAATASFTVPTVLAGMVPQHHVGAYRLDFALPDKRLAIEVDGFTFHSSRDAFNRDRRRQADLEMLGWRVLRFTGDEIRTNAWDCVARARKWVASAGKAE